MIAAPSHGRESAALVIRVSVEEQQQPLLSLCFSMGMLFVPQVLSALRVRRFQFRKKTADLPRGPVQRLVVSDGAWEDRRWNERWLATEVGTNGSKLGFRFMELCYYSEENGQLIHRISSDEICSVKVIKDRVQNDQNSDSFKIGCEDSKLWSIVLNHCDNDTDDLQCGFLIITRPRGNGKAKEYFFKSKTAEERENWVDLISKMIDSNKIKTHWFSKFRSSCRGFYHSTRFQIAAGLMIYINFITNVIAVQANPEQDSDLGIVLTKFDLVLSVIFAVELAFNIFVSQPYEFCIDYWNW